MLNGPHPAVRLFKNAAIPLRCSKLQFHRIKVERQNGTSEQYGTARIGNRILRIGIQDYAVALSEIRYAQFIGFGELQDHLFRSVFFAVNGLYDSQAQKDVAGQQFLFQRTFPKRCHTVGLASGGTNLG